MTATSTTPVKRGPGRPRKVAPRVADQPTLDGSSTEPDRPTDHNGIPVVREELIANLPKAPFKISRLFLADDTVAFACRDCLFTGDSRGAVMLHRNEEHGASFGRSRVDLVPLKTTPDPVLPPRADGPAPSNPLEMTLGEFLALAPSLAALGDLVDHMQSERDDAQAELVELRRHEKENAAKIAHYDQNRDELVYLRNWRRKMIKRLNDMGFSLNEEGE